MTIRKIVRTMIASAAISLSSLPAANAVVVLEDAFGGSSLNASWGAIQTDSTAFGLPGPITAHNATVSGGTWNISSMTHTTNSTFGNVYILRNVASLTSGDFQFSMDFSGLSVPNSDTGHVSANFLDANNAIVAAAGWHDNQGFNATAASMSNLGVVPIATSREINATGTVFGGAAFGHNGHGRIRITRLGANYTIDMGFVPTASFVNYDSIPLVQRLAGPSANLNAISSLMLRFSYLRLDNTLTATPLAIDHAKIAILPALEGDVDNDGGVDIADYVLLQANSFASVDFGSNGDLNGDSFVNFTDFHIWKNAFPGGAAAADAAIAALGVPEPTTVAICGLALPVLLCRYRRRIPC